MSWPGAALLSLSDKRGAAEFAAALAARGTRILASGGTAKHLAAAGVPVTPVEEWTGFGELLGGRVKTLHPHVHAPILARREVPADLAALAERGLVPLDLVAVTLYPFEERAAALDDAGMVEEVDIGGVALLRAAAKNHGAVIVLHDPAQYAGALAALEAGGPTPAQRRDWALRAFARTARYDAAIAAELERRAGAAAGGAEAPPPLHLTLAAMAQAFTGRRLVVAFQPHRYSRTQALLTEFFPIFAEARLLFLTDIYGAGERVIPGLSGRDLYQGVKKAGHQGAYYIADKTELASELWNYLRPGDVLVTMGAGDIWRTGEEILRLLTSRPLPVSLPSQPYAAPSPEVC